MSVVGDNGKAGTEDLTDANEDCVGLVWLDRDEIGGYDLQLVAIDGKDEHCLGGGIYQSKQVLLAGLEGCGEDRASWIRSSRVDGGVAIG